MSHKSILLLYEACNLMCSFPPSQVLHLIYERLSSNSNLIVHRPSIVIHSKKVFLKLKLLIAIYFSVYVKFIGLRVENRVSLESLKLCDSYLTEIRYHGYNISSQCLLPKSISSMFSPALKLRWWWLSFHKLAVLIHQRT